MVLEALWAPRGFILGALGALWGFRGGSLGAPELLKSLGPFDPRAFLSLLMLFFLFFSFFFFRCRFFISSRSLLGSILSSPTDPPTIKNVDSMPAGAWLLKPHQFRSKDGFGSVWGACRLHFVRSWGSLGVSWGFSRGPRAFKIFETA